MRLTREVRFTAGLRPASPVINSFAGSPGAGVVAPYLVLRVCVEGEPDPVTGYLCDIRRIDGVLRERSIPLIGRLMADAGGAWPTGERLIGAVADDLAAHAPANTHWVSITLQLTPYLSCAVHPGDDAMFRVTQCFEFAAAHRLHCPGLSDDENRRVFGKCNNPNGHGHNYQLEITLAGELDPEHGHLLPLERFERTVKERVIDVLDHKHLNEDCPAFRQLNPSVENIARVIWSLLDGQFDGPRLARVRVWETPKTCAEYEGR